MPDPILVTSVQTAICIETVIGTTPTNPVFKILPMLRDGSSILRPTIDAKESDLSRADRQPGGVISTRQAGTGVLNVVLAYEAALEDLMQLALWNTFGVVSGAPTATRRISAQATRYAATIEQKMTYGDGSLQYHRLRGAMVDTADFNLDDKATASFNLQAIAFEQGTTALTGATYTALAGADQMTSDPSGACFEVNGTGLAGVFAASLNVQNGIGVNYSHCTQGADHLTADPTARFTMTNDVYKRTATELTALLAGTTAVIKKIIKDTAGNKWEFILTKARRSDVNFGNAQGTMSEQFTYTAAVDTALSPATALQIQRVAA